MSPLSRTCVEYIILALQPYRWFRSCHWSAMLMGFIHPQVFVLAYLRSHTMMASPPHTNLHLIMGIRGVRTKYKYITSVQFGPYGTFPDGLEAYRTLDHCIVLWEVSCSFRERVCGLLTSLDILYITYVPLSNTSQSLYVSADMNNWNDKTIFVREM